MISAEPQIFTQLSCTQQRGKFSVCVLLPKKKKEKENWFRPSPVLRFPSPRCVHQRFVHHNNPLRPPSPGALVVICSYPTIFSFSPSFRNAPPAESFQVESLLLSLRPCHATGRPLSGRMALVRQMDWRGRIARACRLVEPVGASRREAPGWRCARYAYPLCALARSGP